MNIGNITPVVVLLLSLCVAACQRQVDEEHAWEEPRGIGHVLSGTEDSLIRIDVFSDMQCPACRELFTRTVKPLINDYGDKIGVIYHEYPLSAHRYARPAARYVAASVGLGQRKQLSVYEAIFTEQTYWASNGRLEDVVAKALSREDFLRVTRVLQNPDSLANINEFIERQLRLGVSKGIDATPAMFISLGGKEQKVEGWPDYNRIKRLLDSVLR